MNTRYLLKTLLITLPFVACTGPEETDFFPSSDYLIVENAGMVFKGDGETRTFQFTCKGDWQLSDMPDWITPSSTAGQTQSVQLTAAPNPSIEEQRSGVFVLTSGTVSRKITVTQQAASVQLSVSVADLAFTSDGGSSGFTITSNTSWSISGVADWFSLNHTSGTGNGDITVTVPASTNESDHQATLSIVAAAKVVTVVVSQTGMVVTLSISFTSVTVPCTGATTSLDIVTNATAWSVSSDSEWCTPDILNGSGNATIHITTGGNPQTKSRSAILSVITSSKKVQCTVTQEASSLPTVSTPVVASKDKYNVYLSSGYSSDFPVSEYGFVFSEKNTAPTLSDEKVSLSGSDRSGTIIQVIEGLQPGVSYYVRAFATSSVGTGYSETVTVTTSGSIPGEDENPPIQL